jgi:hypothetical protein
MFHPGLLTVVGANPLKFAFKPIKTVPFFGQMLKTLYDNPFNSLFGNRLLPWFQKS